MSGWNSRSFFRSSQTRWWDEEAATDLLSNDSSPSWQPPPPYTPTSWDRTALNDELLTNEQRHFGETVHDSNNEPNTILAPQNSLTSTGASSHTLERNQGYMEQPSSFAIDSPPTQSTFLESFPKGDATISFPGDNNALESLHNLEILLIQSRCPILGMAFERSRSGPQLYLETLTSATALPFLRYLYTGTYALRGLSGQVEDFYEDVPTSLLLHCQLYRLADIYDLPELKSQAYVNVLRQCEFGCSSPEKPIDLCAAIRFTYEHLREHANLIDAIVNYCVSCFLRHRLAEDVEFKKLGFELRPFHQELCKNSMSREFEDDSKFCQTHSCNVPHMLTNEQPRQPSSGCPSSLSFQRRTSPVKTRPLMSCFISTHSTSLKTHQERGRGQAA